MLRRDAAASTGACRTERATQGDMSVSTTCASFEAAFCASRKHLCALRGPEIYGVPWLHAIEFHSNSLKSIRFVGIAAAGLWQVRHARLHTGQQRINNIIAFSRPAVKPARRVQTRTANDGSADKHKITTKIDPTRQTRHWHELLCLPPSIHLSCVSVRSGTP